MGKIHLIAFLLTFVVSMPVMAFSPCLTSTNSEHIAQGRGTQMNGNRGQGFYANSSQDYMGVDAGAYISLFESSGTVNSILAYYGGDNGWEPVGFDFVSDNTYSVTLYKSGCGCMDILFEGSAWTVSTCDSDEDGMEDQWEYEQLGGLGQGPDDDSDGDGASNLLEFMAGTGGGDASSTPIRGNYYDVDELGRIKSILRAN